MVVTIYKDMLSVNQPHYVESSEVLGWIKNGRWKKNIVEIRSKVGKNSINKLKRKLPAVSFGGKFERRSNEGLIEPSNLAVLDFDDVDKDFKENLIGDSIIHAAFVSPSGNGVKALVKIGTKSSYSNYYKELTRRYGSVDVGGDVSRLCFVSYDPDIYINPDSEVLEDYIEPPKLVLRETVDVETDEGKLYNSCIVCAKKKYTFSEGSRNNFVYEVASMANRIGLSKGYVESRMFSDYVGTGGLPMQEMEGALRSAYRKVEQYNSKPLESKKMIKEEKGERRVVNTEEKLTRIEELSRKVLSDKIDLNKNLPDPVYDGKVHSHGKVYDFADRGGLGAIVGMSGSGKSTIIMAIITSILTRDETLGMDFNIGEKGICLFDTEQSEQSLQSKIKKQLPIRSDRLTACMLAELPWQDRADVIENIIAKKSPGLVIIDVLSDLLKSFNDEEGAQQLIDRISSWRRKYKCMVIVVLHLNEAKAGSWSKASGWIGSILKRKITFGIQLSLDEDMSKFGVSTYKTRDVGAFKTYDITWNDHGQPIVATGEIPALDQMVKQDVYINKSVKEKESLVSMTAHRPSSEEVDARMLF